MIIDSRYKVLETLGSGAYANVYRVMDIRTSQTFSLKLFQRIEASTLYETLTAEDMHQITKLRHPNLLHIYNFGNMDKHIYYIGEYYPGKTLKNFKFSIANNHFLYDIISQVCYALDSLHNQNILHRDIKPENIMYQIIDNKIEVKVLDYGFNKIDTERNQQKISGTLPYIAPEVYTGQGACAQSDFYSLGVTLYYLVTGSLPFSQDQIADFIQGNQQSFFPKFPREFNPDIPIDLEKFILKLLEKKPEDRFADCQSIINYLNRMQDKKYPFSQKQSTINFFQFGYYLVRKDYALQLKDYLKNIINANGKVIALVGGQGLGKEDLLTLFRYHILTNEYYIFDYTCSAQNRDPFFALIKEFSSSTLNNERKNTDFVNISERFRKYLEQSEEIANQLSSDTDKLEEDYKTGQSFLRQLSQDRPLVFIIRQGQHLTKETLDFLNYVSNDINELPILIVISINNPMILKNLNHYVKLILQPLTLIETRTYLEEIFKCDIPDSFIFKIWRRSNGNPRFIIDILVDLSRKKLLFTNEEICFTEDIDDYTLPDNLIHSIYNRMSHLTAQSYRLLQKLSCIYTPLSKELIVSILDIDKKKLFNLLNDSLNNEILFKEKNIYKFTFNEARIRFFNECSDAIKMEISTSLINYYNKEDSIDIPTAQGIIENCQLSVDYESQRRYKLLLFNLYSQKFDQNNAYKQIYEIIGLDFSNKLQVSDSEKQKDLILLVEKADLTGEINKTYDLLNSLPDIPDFCEKYYAYGMLYIRMENFKKAEELYDRAYELAITGKQQGRILIDLIWIYILNGDKNRAQSAINQLSEYQLTYDLEIALYDRKGMFISRFDNEQEAIAYLESVLSKIRQVTDTPSTIRLASVYNNLAILYSSNKMYEEAKEYFFNTKAIWEKIHHERLLGTIYNNIGDYYLKQGNTIQALESFQVAKDISEKIHNSRGVILALLNFGEANIKLGNFTEAEKYLLEAKEETEKLENKLFYKSILYNLGIAKSKINNFNYYLSFINQDEVKSEFHDITQINPLIKSYFYYLCEVGQTEKINSLFLNNINFTKTHDEEFYYQILGIVAMLKSDFTTARNNFQKSLQYANQIKSNYSISINYLRLALCNIKLMNYKEAEENLKSANTIIDTYKFQYWSVVIMIFKIQLGLNKKETPLRTLLRKAFETYRLAKENCYFVLELDCLALICEIYEALSARKHATSYYQIYQQRVKEVARNIPEEDQKTFYQIRKIYIQNVKDFSLFPITNRHSKGEYWQDELYGLLKIDDMNQIRYLLDKYINELFSPYKMMIIITKKAVSYNDFLEPLNYETFLVRNFSPFELIEYNDLIKESLSKREVMVHNAEGRNIMVAPLWLRSNSYGCLVMTDNGELQFLKSEAKAMKLFAVQLSTLLIRIIEFESIHKKMSKMQEVLDISRRFMQEYDLKRLETDIVNYAVSLCNAKRGVLIKKDKSGNYLFHMAFDNEKNILSSFPNISKTALSQVQYSKTPLFTINVFEDNLFKNSASIFQYQINSLLCAPIIIDDQIYALLYLDNYEDLEQKMFTEEEVINMFLVQISLALKNAIAYDTLMKKNWELHTLDTMKNEFIAIVSHELNTPLITLQGYMNKLKKNANPKDLETTELLGKVDKSTKKLMQTIQDIITLNRYNAAKDLELAPNNVNEILIAITAEAEIIGKQRKMRFKLEIEENLPEIKMDWKAFYVMIYNLVLNAIRFTSDYGTIVIGSRLATFQQEKVDDLDSLILYVQDNGIGIPEHEQQNVFKSFYELGDMLAHRSGNVEYRSSGLGLGLSTSKRIAELHKGKIWLRSKEAEGTTVFISIPFQENKSLIKA